MKKFTVLIFGTFFIFSCSHEKLNPIASTDSQFQNRSIASKVEQKDLLKTILGRSPISSLSDIYQEGMQLNELSEYKFYAMHPLAPTGYYPVTLTEYIGDGYFKLETKNDVAVYTSGVESAGLSAGVIKFQNNFSEHSNNIVYEMPNGSFNRPQFIVGKKICTDPKKALLKFCGNILRIYSSGELLIKFSDEQKMILPIEKF